MSRSWARLAAAGMVGAVLAVLPVGVPPGASATTDDLGAISLPAYVPAGVTGSFDVATGMFNLGSANTVRTRAAVAAADTSPMNQVFVGDSITAGWNALTPTYSGTIDRDKSWPYLYQRALNARLGLPAPGTGLVRAFELNGVSQSYFDARWSPGPNGIGIQARDHYVAVNNSTLTFDSGKPGFTSGTGTAVAVVYLDSGNFVVSVDGGSPRSVTGAGTGLVRRWELRGLAAGTHVVKIQVASDQHVNVVGAEVFSGRGFSASNVAQGGSGVTGGAQDDWSVPGPPSASLSELFSDPHNYSSTPSTVYIALGGNDLKTNGDDLSRIREGILETADFYRDADIVLIAEPHGSSSFTTVDNKPLIGMLYQLAAQQDWPLWDLEWFTGGYELNGIRGMNGDAYGHLTTSGYAWLGTTLAEVMAHQLASSASVTTNAGPATVGGQSFSTSSLAYGAWPVGENSPAVSVSVTNTSNGRVQMVPSYGSTEFRSAPARPGDCVQDSDGASGYLVLDQGESCRLRPVFAPTTAGTTSAAIVVSERPSGQPAGALAPLSTASVLASHTLSVSASAAVPKFALSPNSLSFGSLALFQSKSLTTVVKNSSTLPLQFDVADLGPEAQFRAAAVEGSGMCLTPEGAVSVLPGGSCTLRVEYRPTASGAAKATLTVQAHRSSSDGVGPATNRVAATATLAVSGTGVAPTWTTSATSLTFGNVTVGVAKKLSVTLKNTSTVPLALGAATSAGSSYAVDDGGAGSCGAAGAPQLVPAGSSCVVSVRFLPTAVGSVADTLELTATEQVDGVTTVVGSKTVALGGSGIAPTFSASTSAPAFGSVVLGSSKVLAVTLRNTSQASLFFSPAYPDPATFGTAPALDGSDCVPAGAPVAIAPAGSCTLRIRFSPQVAGSVTQTILIVVGQDVDGARRSVGQLALKPTGSGTLPTFTVAPTSLAFGTVAPGASKTLTTKVTNTSSVSLVVSPTVTGGTPFALAEQAGGGCSSSGGQVVVGPGAVCTVAVVFAPTSTGAKKATLTVAVSAFRADAPALAAGSKTLALSGAGG